MAKIEALEDYAARRNRVLRFVADLRPTELEPFAALLSKADMQTLRSLEDSGDMMRCTETGRWFVPSLARAA